MSVAYNLCAVWKKERKGEDADDTQRGRKLLEQSVITEINYNKDSVIIQPV